MGCASIRINCRVPTLTERAGIVTLFPSARRISAAGPDPRSSPPSVRCQYACAGGNSRSCRSGRGLLLGSFRCAKCKNPTQGRVREILERAMLTRKFGVVHFCTVALERSVSRICTTVFERHGRIVLCISFVYNGLREIFSSRSSTLTFPPVAATALTRHVTARSNFF